VLTGSGPVQITGNAISLNMAGNSGVAATSGTMSGVAGTVTCDDGNKNITTSGCSGGSGGSSYVDWQKQTSSGAITMTASTDNTIYSTTIAGGTIAAGHCLEVKGGFQALSGGANTVKLFYGTAALTLSTTSATNYITFIANVCNDPSFTNSQQIQSIFYGDSNNNLVMPTSPATGAIDSTVSQVLKLTVNPAGGGTATGFAWKVDKN
jgi:hypothetical protein